MQDYLIFNGDNFIYSWKIKIPWEFGYVGMEEMRWELEII